MRKTGINPQLLSEPDAAKYLSICPRLGVPSGWLRDRAVANDVPALLAGNRWMFRPDVVTPIFICNDSKRCSHVGLQVATKILSEQRRTIWFRCGFDNELRHGLLQENYPGESK